MRRGGPAPVSANCGASATVPEGATPQRRSAGAKVDSGRGQKHSRPRRPPRRRSLQQLPRPYLLWRARAYPPRDPAASWGRNASPDPRQTS